MAGNFQSRRYQNTGGLRLSHHDCTVGWICALPCELAAAEAMFDTVHEALPNPPQDKNIYSLGSISDHNVVVTTLPIGSYGTNSAAAVAIRLTSTFRSISVPLMVGIGGGVPVDDIRLGDVVVSIPKPGSHAVVQYDYGKILRSGTVQLTGNLNKPTTQLLTAVSYFQARYQSQPSCIPETMQLAKCGNSFIYPGPENDVLYTSDCLHEVKEWEACEECIPKPVSRSERLSNSPRIHYGSIASGNLVIKSGRVRDKLASDLGNLCFEMEAAGIMDHFPALVVRGIADYCDSHKNKIFQTYAALAAAAFAKQLLLMLPQEPMPTLYKTVIEPLSEAVVQQLTFSEAQSRLLTIKDPHPNTLKWLLNHDAYLSWLDDSKYPIHQGFLWIKAKPGAGKSTLMKYILSQVKRTETVTISFFFIARGSELQRTTMGMYRSLLYQLLQHFPELQHSLGLLILKEELGRFEVLKSLFKAAVELIHQPLICFIDALDESSEDEIRELLDDLESITEHPAQRSFRICCSSRYYPHISIQAGLDLYLDKEAGHTVDIANYVDAKLRIGISKEAQQIKADILSKSAGIFLWVVLVVQILKREYDRGRIHAMQMKLKVTPSELSELIRDILLRDNEHLQDLVYSIQWVLYSRRPLYVDEFYWAVLSADEEYPITSRDGYATTLDDMERFITSSSKGLLESTIETRPKIQVIHESVREFLLHGTLTDIWSGFAAVAVGWSNDRIGRCCLRYLCAAISGWASQAIEGTLNSHHYPLYGYTCAFLLQHAEIAELSGVSQGRLLEELSNLERMYLRHLCEPKTDKGLSITWQDTDLLSLLVRNNLPSLVRRYFSPGFASSDAKGRNSAKSRDDLLTHCIKYKFVEMLKILLEPAPKKQVRVEQYEQAITQVCKSKGSTFLSCLISHRQCELATYLLESEEWLKNQEEDWITRLIVGCAMSQLRLSSNLEGDLTIDFRISEDKIDCSEANLREILRRAAIAGNLWVLNKLMDLGVDPNSRDLLNQTVLHIAVEERQTQIVARLAQSVDIDARDWIDQTPLAVAMLHEYTDIADILIQNGASIDAALVSRTNDLWPLDEF